MNCRILLLLGTISVTTSCVGAEPDPKLRQALEAELKAFDADIRTDANDVRALSGRGDTLFFLGRFDEAIRDYDRMIELAPEIRARHWQRGLALYFAGRYDESAKQFEEYYKGDKADRENGIWRYYAQVEKHGLESARKSLLPYSEPDRAPLPLVYRVCEGQATPDDVLRSVESEEVQGTEREKQRFYAHLYMGLDAAFVRDDPHAARPLLERALKNAWPRNAGYGPNFMWHVARLSLGRLQPGDATPPNP